MGFALGGSEADAIKLGGADVDKIMLGDTQVWPKPIPILAEFTMGDASKYFRMDEVHTDKASVQYSKDKVTWLDMTTNVDANGSLKWYVRHKPGTPEITQLSFQDSDIIKVDSIDTSKITSFVSMFRGCKLLVEIPELDMSQGISFSTMFRDCKVLTSLGVLNTVKGNHFGGTFMHCEALTCIKSIDTTHSNSSSFMFSSNGALLRPNASEITQISAKPGIAWVNPMPCHEPPPPPFEAEFTMADTVGVLKVDVNHSNIQYSEDNVTWLDTTGATDLTGSLKWYLRQKQGTTDIVELKLKGSDMVSVDKILTSHFDSFAYMFEGCAKLVSIPDMDTKKGTYFVKTFRDCTALTTVPTTLDTGQGTSFVGMFRGCTSLISPPKLNVENGADLSFMFLGCTSLLSIPVLNSVKGTDFMATFKDCTALKCLGGINSKKSTNGALMFDGATALTAPSAAKQTQLAATPGIAWTNPNSCP